MADDRSVDRGAERMQRVRVGLTGLACVFLLVLLAAAFFGLTNDERKTGPLVVPEKTGPATSGDPAATPREPLAELGVAPGFGGDAAATNVATAAPPAAPRPPSPPR